MKGEIIIMDGIRFKGRNIIHASDVDTSNYTPDELEQFYKDFPCQKIRDERKKDLT